IHDAISRTKREIAAIHGKSFDGNEMAKINGELGAVANGTEQATQQILEAAESIDQAASALSKVNSPDQQKILSEEIQERVVSIFEACNFQDLTGQRINKVMNTMKFIEQHISEMMEIWGGVDAIKAHAPQVIDTREGDERLLNGPKLEATRVTPRRTTSTRCSTDVVLKSQPNKTAGNQPAFFVSFILLRHSGTLAKREQTRKSRGCGARIPASRLSPRRGMMPLGWLTRTTADIDHVAVAVTGVGIDEAGDQHPAVERQDHAIIRAAGRARRTDIVLAASAALELQLLRGRLVGEVHDDPAVTTGADHVGLLALRLGLRLGAGLVGRILVGSEPPFTDQFLGPDARRQCGLGCLLGRRGRRGRAAKMEARAGPQQYR